MIVPMLRGDQSNGTRMRAVASMLGLGVLAALLVLAGNPGNMGLCGACFLRDLAGALRLHQGPAIVRPEVPGVVLGALLWSLLSRRHIGRSGSHAVARLLLCAAMAIGAMVFLGCPFRMLQRLGGGDLNAWLALPGFVVGVGVARWFEQRGYSLGKTQEVPRPIGLIGPLVLFVPLLAWLAGSGLAGPAFGADAAVGPAQAPWLLALGIALLGGGVLSATVDGGPNPRDSGGLPGIWFFLKQRSSWVWFLATAAKVSAAGTTPRGSGGIGNAAVAARIA